MPPRRAWWRPPPLAHTRTHTHTRARARALPSPRSHCDHCLRLPWLYQHHSRELFDALRLREALTPALYTAHRESIDSGIVPVHPVYYHCPALEDAYQHDHQYMFTRHVLVSPITLLTGSPGASVPLAAWLPPGQWVAWDGSRTIAGPALDAGAAYSAGQVPAFVPLLTLLPLKRGPFTGSPRAATGWPTPDLQWTLWVGAGQAGAGSGEVYEDDGATLAWRAGAGASAVTRATANASAEGLEFAVLPVEGGFPGMEGARGVSLQVRGGAAWGGRVQGVAVNGQAVPASATQVPGWWVQVEEASSGLLLPLGSLNVNVGQVRGAEGVRVSIALAASAA